MKLTDLATLFDQQIKQNLEPIESSRKKCLHFVKINSGFTAILAVCYIIMKYMDKMDKENNLLLFNIFTFGLIIFLFFLTQKNKKMWDNYRKTYKEKVVHAITQAMGHSFIYDPNGKINQNIYEKSGLSSHNYHHFAGEDYFKGRVGQTDIEFSELNLTKNNYNRYSLSNKETIFQGLFFIIDFNKNFKSDTYVISSNQFLNILFTKNTFKNATLTKFEDPSFEKIFDVFTTDEIEARYILTPSLMNRLCDIYELSPTSVSLAFKQGLLYIKMGLGGKRIFEPKLFKPADDFENVREIFEQITFCLDIVEELNLNTRIWTKA